MSWVGAAWSAYSSQRLTWTKGSKTTTSRLKATKATTRRRPTNDTALTTARAIADYILAKTTHGELTTCRSKCVDNMISCSSGIQNRRDTSKQTKTACQAAKLQRLACGRTACSGRRTRQAKNDWPAPLLDMFQPVSPIPGDNHFPSKAQSRAVDTEGLTFEEVQGTRLTPYATSAHADDIEGLTNPMAQHRDLNVSLSISIQPIALQMCQRVLFPHSRKTKKTHSRSNSPFLSHYDSRCLHRFIGTKKMSHVTRG